MTDETTQALLPCPPCPICRADATWETALTANVGGKEVIYGSCSECSCTAEYHDWLAHSRPSQADATSGEEMRLREALAGLVKWSDNIMRAHGVTGEQIAVTKARAALTKGAE